MGARRIGHGCHYTSIGANIHHISWRDSATFGTECLRKGRDETEDADHGRRALGEKQKGLPSGRGCCCRTTCWAGVSERSGDEAAVSEVFSPLGELELTNQLVEPSEKEATGHCGESAQRLRLADPPERHRMRRRLARLSRHYLHASRAAVPPLSKQGRLPIVFGWEVA
jgi:hypothetical protein